MSEKTILIVEDDFLNRRHIKKILLKSGYQVLESKNSKEALDIINLKNIDLAILDINLGNDTEEGIKLGQQIKTDYSFPFIYLTAYANIPTLTLATATKPYSYLTKPFKEIDLIASIEITIDRANKSQEKVITSINVKYQDHFVELPLNEIDYIEAKGNYLICLSGSKLYKYRSTIKQMLALATATTFIQIHRGFLVNKVKIEKYNAKNVLINQRKIAISRNYKKNLFSK